MLRKGIAHVALVLEVDGQVEKVVLALELLINSGQQHLLRVFVGDVLHHECGALVLPCTAGLLVSSFLSRSLPHAQGKTLDLRM